MSTTTSNRWAGLRRTQLLVSNWSTVSQFEGGVIAAAAHATGILSDSAVRCIGGDVYRKERWIEASHLHKLFECYVLESKSETTDGDQDLADYDAVIVTDYGHGMADKEFIESLDAARYLAVNVQTNSGNYGFNLATKYSWCEYLCVDEPEARLGDSEQDQARLKIAWYSYPLSRQRLSSHLGRAGRSGTPERALFRCPAFTDKVVDTIGAGDAFFAVTAPMAEEADMKSLLRIGNAAGAIKANIVGHRGSVTKDELIKYLARVPA